MGKALLLDIGNTNTHLGLADERGVRRQADVPTSEWRRDAPNFIRKFVGRERIECAALCSVVPKVTPLARRFIEQDCGVPCLILTHETVQGIGLDYPKPQTIGADRLANAMAARHRFGAPVVVVDFGTAVTFDVVDRCGNYVGGIIAPGLSAMTTYLHEKTALLPAIEVHETDAVIGKSTEEAMLVGTVHGYRGLVRELLMELRKELKVRRLPVVATGGYAELIAARLPEIQAVEPALTLEGLRLLWLAKFCLKSKKEP